MEFCIATGLDPYHFSRKGKFLLTEVEQHNNNTE